MAFWIFKCNPELYRLEDRLGDPNPTLSWTVSRHREEIGPGDTVFLWVTGPKRGIRAVMRVDQAPQELAELESEQSYWAGGRDTEKKWRVIGTLTHRDVNLSHTDLREEPGLEDLAVFQGFQQRQTSRSHLSKQPFCCGWWKVLKHDDVQPRLTSG